MAIFLQDGRCQKVRTVFREFAQMSSTHGINHMGEAHRRRVLFFWAIILIACALGFAYLFSSILRKYLRYDVVVEISVSAYTCECCIDWLKSSISQSRSGTALLRTEPTENFAN